MTPEESKRTLESLGYNWALSDVQLACASLGHPELAADDIANYHKWAQPYLRRCYCGEIGYTNDGKFYANKSSHPDLMKKMFPEWRENFEERYEK